MSNKFTNLPQKCENIKKKNQKTWTGQQRGNHTVSSVQHIRWQSGLFFIPLEEKFSLPPPI